MRFVKKKVYERFIYGKQRSLFFGTELVNTSRASFALCLTLLKDQQGDSVGVPPLFSLAVANNRGVIFIQLNELESASVCFKRCMSILVVFVDRQTQDRVHDFERYLSNACHRSCCISVMVAQAA